MMPDRGAPKRFEYGVCEAARWDAIVVGSGMGGMTAAAALSKVGRKVLLLEQHWVLGGLTHSFSRGDLV